MKRRHLFEFNEAAWVPQSIKALVTDYLRTVIEWAEPFSPQLPLMAQSLRRSGEDTSVVDLCSGGGGPWRHLSPQLDRMVKREVPVTLTDKYPDRRAAALPRTPAAVSWHSEPVDATDVPESLRGMRTLFNGFHHFKPATATRILSSAVENNESIVVMEMLRRSYQSLLWLLFTPVLVWLVTPWIRPFSWSRLALTYVLPVAPLVIFWDTFVSILRCYTPRELQHMGQVAAGDRYEWFSGAYRYRRVSVTFLIGYPRKDRGDAGASDD